MDLEGYEPESMLAHKHTEVCERIVKMGDGRMKTMFKTATSTGAKSMNRFLKLHGARFILLVGVFCICVKQKGGALSDPMFE